MADPILTDARHRDLCWLGRKVHADPVALYFIRLAPHRCEKAIVHLNSVARMAGAADAWSLDWAVLTIQDIQSLKARLTERYARSTVNEQLACLRGVYRACLRLGQIDDYRLFDALKPLHRARKRPAAGRHHDLLWLAQKAQHHPVAFHLITQSPGSRPSVLSSLNSVARMAGAADAWSLDWAALTIQDIQSLKARMAERYALASVNKHLVCLRGVVGACWQLGQIDADTYMRLNQFKQVRGHRLPAGRMLDDAEWTALLSACHNDPMPAGRRDAAILALMVGAGLRRAEIVALPISAYASDEQTVRVLGKGNKERVVPVPRFVAAAVEPWLTVRGSQGEALFVHCHSIRVHGLRPFAAAGQNVSSLLEKRRAQAGIAPCTPHDLRRTYISRLLLAGVDVFTVQQLAGHMNIKNTALYDRRSDDRLREAINRLPNLYVRPTGRRTS